MRTNLASIAYAQLRTASTHASLRGPSIQAIAPSLFVSRRFASVEKVHHHSQLLFSFFMWGNEFSSQ